MSRDHDVEAELTKLPGELRALFEPLLRDPSADSVAQAVMLMCSFASATVLASPGPEHIRRDVMNKTLGLAFEAGRAAGIGWTVEAGAQDMPELIFKTIVDAQMRGLRKQANQLHLLTNELEEGEPK